MPAPTRSPKSRRAAGGKVGAGEAAPAEASAELTGTAARPWAECGLLKPQEAQDGESEI